MLSRKKFTVLMGGLLAIASLGLDGLLPAIPEMSLYFGVASNKMAMIVTVFTLGLAIGQLIGGPLADRIGKKSVILMGLFLFILISIAIAFTSSFNLLLILRCVQAFGAGFVMVCIAPLIKDRASDAEAAQMFAMIGLVMITAPALAPSIGTLVLHFFDWRYIFLSLVIYSVLIGFVFIRTIPSDKPKNVETKSALQRYKAVLQNKKAMPVLLAQATAFSVLLTIITNGSFIYQEVFAYSKAQFATAFALNVVVMAAFNIGNGLLVKKVSVVKLLLVGLFLNLLSTLIFAVLVMVNAPITYSVVAIMFCVGTLGLVLPNAMALFMSLYEENVGAASALFGAAQSLFGAIIASASTLLNTGQLAPITILLVFIALLSNLIMWLFFDTNSKKGNHSA